MINTILFSIRSSPSSTVALKTPANHSLPPTGSPSCPWTPTSGSAGCTCIASLSFWSMTCKWTQPGLVSGRYSVVLLVLGKFYFLFELVWKCQCSLNLNGCKLFCFASLCSARSQKHVHNAGCNGRFSTIQCRISHSALTSLLRDWSSFVLVEGYSYVKLIYRCMCSSVSKLQSSVLTSIILTVDLDISPTFRHF